MTTECEITVSCPHCGSTDIGGMDHILVSAHVTEWVRDDNGEIKPVWAGESEIYWDTQEPLMPTLPYQCNACGGYLSTNDLVVKESA